MKDYYGRIIDVHTHIFPEKIAEKATKAIGDFYDIPMQRIGYKNTLLEQMATYGIKKCFIHSTATVPSQVHQINVFLTDVLAENPQKFVAFGTLHADMDDMQKELDFMRNNGITGIKFHNDFQKFAVDDKRVYEIYERCEAEKIPLMFHAGDKRYHFTNPSQFIKVIKRFPKLIAIAAHFGAYSEWDKVDEEYCETPYYFDTSSALFELKKDRALEIINRHGADKFMFGTDFPMWTVPDEYRNIENLELDRQTLEKIMFGNAEHFLERCGK